MFLFKTFYLFIKMGIFPNIFNVFGYAKRNKLEKLYGENGKNFLLYLFMNFHIKQSLWMINNSHLFIKSEGLKSNIKDTKFFSFVFFLMYFATIGSFSFIPFPPTLFIAFIVGASVFFSFFIYSMWVRFTVLPLNELYNDLQHTHSRAHKYLLETSILLREENENEKISRFYCLTRMFRPYSGSYFEKFKKSKHPYMFILKTFSFYHLNIHRKNFSNIFPDYAKEQNMRKKRMKDKLFFVCAPAFICSLLIIQANFKNLIFLAFLGLCGLLLLSLVFIIVREYFIDSKDEHMQNIMSKDSIKFVEYFSSHEKTIFLNQVEKHFSAGEEAVIKRKRL